MTRSTVALASRAGAVALVGLVCACARSPISRSGLDASVVGSVASLDGGRLSDRPGQTSAGDAPTDATAVELPPACATASVPPATLICTGLYADIVSKQIAPGIEAYAPAVPLWSDGAEKQRWIFLPPGQVIDNADPDEWSFPVGTKVWKEFSKDGRRVETRLWQKAATSYWVDATYAWNADESAATQSPGGDIPLGTGTYHIPTPDECQDCHRGRTDRILGFEQVLLGLAGATGLNLDELIADHRLSAPPTFTPLVIGDDGTGLAAPALAWMHVNCGTTCHNRNSNAMAWSTGMFMRLDPTQLDGRSVAAFDSLTTTIGVAAVTPAWTGQPRILPGDPAHSLLYSLISHRGTGEQMPPIASSVVDEADIPLVEAWIAEMAVTPPHADGGADDAARPDDDAASDRPAGDVGEGAASDAASPPPDASARPPDAGGGDLDDVRGP
jgi:hypothetical protein